MKKYVPGILFLLMLFANMCMHASDSLKVKKVRFFVEPKFMVNIPKNHTSNYNGFDPDNGFVISHGGNYTAKTITQNKAAFSFGLSAGMSVKLSKHLFYELTLSYYQSNLSSKTIHTQTFTSGTPETDIYSVSNQSTYNYLGLGNGISYRCNKLSFTHTVLLYQAVYYKQLSVYGTQDSYGNSTQSYPSTGNTTTDGLHLKVMSEHKVGYSFLHDRIVPCIGVNFNWSSSFYTANGKTQFKPVWLPFASVKINF